MFGRRVEVALDTLGVLPDDEPTAQVGTAQVIAELARAIAMDLEAAHIPAVFTRSAEKIFRGVS